MFKLWLLYYVSSIKIYLLSTRQNFQSRLRFEGNKSSSTFHKKSSDTILSATLNLWSNIQIVKIHTLKHNISDSISLIIKYLNFETLHYCFKHISDKVICYVLDNIENITKICFLTQKYVCYSCIFGKIY